MIVTPFETYQHYLSLKNHFTNPKYDFFKYGAKTRSSVTSFNKRTDKYWFEKTSRKYSDKEVVDFLVSNFVETDSPGNLWIGQIINYMIYFNIHLRSYRTQCMVHLLKMVGDTQTDI